MLPDEKIYMPVNGAAIEIFNIRMAVLRLILSLRVTTVNIAYRGGKRE